MEKKTKCEIIKAIQALAPEMVNSALWRKTKKELIKLYREVKNHDRDV